MSDRRHTPGTSVLLIAVGALLAWTAWSALHRTVLLDGPLPDAAHSTGATLPDMRIDINTAGAAEMSVLPAIGPGLAERIIENREKSGPFARVDDLTRVSGIGPATIERMRAFAVARPVVPPATHPTR